jgi:hypothetical protein
MFVIELEEEPAAVEVTGRASPFVEMFNRPASVIFR